MSAFGILGIIFVVILLGCFGIWLWNGYNSLILRKQNVKIRFSDLAAEYQRRADLFYNFVQTVKSYADFENKTQTDVIAMRKGKVHTADKKSIPLPLPFEQYAEMDLGKLNVVVEKYPDLKATGEYHTFMEQIEVIEGKIIQARASYNEVVRAYNLFVIRFPSKIIAFIFGYGQEEYFKNEDGAEKTRINLENKE